MIRLSASFLDLSEPARSLAAPRPRVPSTVAVFDRMLYHRALGLCKAKKIKSTRKAIAPNIPPEDRLFVLCFGKASGGKRDHDRIIAPEQDVDRS